MQSSNEVEESFYEGQFLGVLFDLVESIVDRDYDVNLEVTALCAKLAFLPHPYTHEYLLNPTIPLVPRLDNWSYSVTFIREKFNLFF